MSGEISALGCAFCWACSATLTKSLAGGFDPAGLNFFRCLAAAILFLAIFPFFSGTDSITQASLPAVIFLILSALVGISFGDTIYIRALKLIRVTLALPLIQSGMPLFTLLGAALFLGEPLTWTLIMGTALILGGIYLIASTSPQAHPSRPHPPGEKKKLGIALVVIASLCWAVSNILVKLGLESINLIAANTIRMPVAALALFLTLLWQGRSPTTNLSPAKLGLAAVAGLLGFGIGGILFFEALHLAGAGKGTVLVSSAPLFGLPLSVFLLKEKVTFRIAAGTVGVVLGIFLIL